VAVHVKNRKKNKKIPALSRARISALGKDGKPEYQNTSFAESLPG